MNGMLWLLEEEEGRGGEELFVGSLLEKKKKKTAIALLHDWAFVTAIVLPATSARDSVAPSQAACNQSLMTHN